MIPFSSKVEMSVSDQLASPKPELENIEKGWENSQHFQTLSNASQGFGVSQGINQKHTYNFSSGLFLWRSVQGRTVCGFRGGRNEKKLEQEQVRKTQQRTPLEAVRAPLPPTKKSGAFFWRTAGVKMLYAVGRIRFFSAIEAKWFVCQKHLSSF